MPERNISTALRALIVANDPTLTGCIKITAQDDTIIGFTNYSETIEFNGDTYIAAPGLSLTNISTSLGLGVDNLETGGAFKDGVITEAQVRAGKWDYARYELFILSYTTLSAGRMLIQTGRLREVRMADNAFTAELASLAQILQTTVGDLTSPKCRVKDVFDSKCGLIAADSHPTVSLPYVLATATVGTVTNHITFTVASSAYPSNFFTNGKLTWLTGENAGIVSEVKQYLLSEGVGYYVVQEPPANGDIESGDTFSVRFGCNRTWTRCGEVENRVNFRGEPYLIGTQKALVAK